MDENGRVLTIELKVKFLEEKNRSTVLANLRNGSRRFQPTQSCRFSFTEKGVFVPWVIADWRSLQKIFLLHCGRGDHQFLFGFENLWPVSHIWTQNSPKTGCLRQTIREECLFGGYESTLYPSPTASWM